MLNPFDPRSVKWDLFAELKSPYDVEQLARSLIPDHEGADRSWRGYARTFFSAVTSPGARGRCDRHGGALSVDGGRRYPGIAHPGARDAGAAVPGRAQQPDVRFDSLRNQFSGRCARLHRAAEGGADFRFANGWPRNVLACCSCRTRPAQIAALRSTISGWMRLAIFEAMEQGEQPAGEPSRNAGACGSSSMSWMPWDRSTG